MGTPEAPGYWDEVVKAARAGDVASAREILKTSLACLGGFEIPEAARLFMLQAITDYLEKAKPERGDLERALFLSPPAHRPKEFDRALQIRIARYRRIRVSAGVVTSRVRTSPIGKNIEGLRPVSWLVARVHQRAKSRGITKSAAMEWAANRYKIPFQTLEGYEREYSPLRSFDAKQLNTLIYLGRWAVKSNA
jgi:hypothetical protein